MVELKHKRAKKKNSNKLVKFVEATLCTEVKGAVKATPKFVVKAASKFVVKAASKFVVKAAYRFFVKAAAELVEKAIGNFLDKTVPSSSTRPPPLSDPELFSHTVPQVFGLINISTIKRNYSIFFWSFHSLTK